MNCPKCKEEGVLEVLANGLAKCKKCARKFKRMVTNPGASIRKVGRNELCPCKSGRKWKHCCGKA